MVIPRNSARLSAAALRAANLNVALLANNHQKDFGDDALAESIQGLAANGIASVGASMEREMRWRPRIFDVPGKPLRIAVLAFLRSESTGEPSTDRRMEFNGQIRSEWTNVAHLKKRFEAPYEAARATRPPNTPNPTKNRPQDTHNTLTEQENSARASSADQLSIRWAIRPKRQNRRLRTLRSPNSRPERAPARAWCGRRRACRPGRWGRS